MDAVDDVFDRRARRNTRDLTQLGADLLPSLAVGLEPEPALEFEVSACPQPGDRGEVVGGHRRHGQLRELRRRLLLEPDEPIREQAAGRQGVEDLRLGRAQVLGDHVGASLRALACDDVEQVGEGVADVDALGGTSAIGHPVEAGQSEGVVDAEGAGVAQAGADGFDEGAAARGAQLPRVERRQAPHLSLGVELVGRRTNGDAGR